MLDEHRSDGLIVLRHEWQTAVRAESCLALRFDRLLLHRRLTLSRLPARSTVFFSDTAQRAVDVQASSGPSKFASLRAVALPAHGGKMDEWTERSATTVPMRVSPPRVPTAARRLIESTPSAA